MIFRRLRLPVAGILSLACVSGLGADVFHLRDGRRIQVGEWHETDSEYIYDRFGGTVAIPKSIVVRVEKTTVRAPTPPSAQQAPSRTRGTPQAGPPASPPPAPKIAPVPAPMFTPDPEQAVLLQQEYDRGEQARLESRFEAAVLAYESVLRIDPAHLDAGLYRTACYFWLKRYDQALSAARESMVYHPTDPSLLFLAGEVYYFQDRLALALDSWQQALAVREHPSIRDRIEKVRRELDTEQSYLAIPGNHFRIRYDGDGGSEDLAREVLEFLDDRIGDLSLRLDHFPASPLSVVLYPGREFHAATLADHNVEGLFDGKIRLPVGGVNRLTDPLRRVLEHELAHALIDSKSGGNCPRWLHEGIAQHLSGVTSLPFRDDLARQFLQLADSGDWHPVLSYPAALSCVDYVSSQHGFTAWLSILDRLGRGAGFPDALWESLRTRPQELFVAWGEALQDGAAARR
jgi:hypothetical protein